jgi:levansucrase
LTNSLNMPASSTDGVARWTHDHVRAIEATTYDCIPIITDQDIVRISPDLDIWDAWPIQDEDGHPSKLDGGQTLWMALGSPRFADPDERHGHARIHLISLRDGAWTHLGTAIADGFTPGSREWSGSAVLDADRENLTLYFTATGHRGEAGLTFEQRLFRATAKLVRDDDSYTLTDWAALDEFIKRDAAHYMCSTSGSGAVGTIKAFRDPAYFSDPNSGHHYAFFAASLEGSTSAFNGVVGAAVSRDAAANDWETLPPQLIADDVNNELERPHVIHHGGLYYLFWSTQRHVFNPEGPTGPTGLYGMVSDRIDGGWQPLNGTGLVFANPDNAPKQSYSWLVMPDLQVTSFIDAWGSNGKDELAKRFGATFAPMLRLRLDGASAGLAEQA